MTVEVVELIGAVEAGRYVPTPGSVGDRLLSTCSCRCHGGRTLAMFARDVVRAQGLAWLWFLEADPSTMDDDESLFVLETWRDWLNGKRPRAGRVSDAFR